jgi:hypothetical protein
MKIVIFHDEDGGEDGKVEEFQHVTDAYLCVRQSEPFQKDDSLTFVSDTRSYSWGSNVREIIKELSQSLLELREFLKKGTTN